MPEPEGGSVANKGGQRAGGKAKQKPNDEGSTHLCWTPAEKVVLWKAIQKHNPFAESGQKLVRKHWRRAAAFVIEDQDVEVYTNEGGRETVLVCCAHVLLVGRTVRVSITLNLLVVRGSGPTRTFPT
ncbi:unnamed protein product [Ectocarpus sp. CCAP 1310/34]|nr:unnamed protein product [Ectocarpus sp. CCAP 1310/34]